MCLITEQKKPIKIRKDYTVYKLVEFLNEKEIRSFYNYNFTWELNKLYQTEIKKSSILNACYFDLKSKECYQGKDGIKYIEVLIEKLRNEELYSYGSGFHSAINKSRIKSNLYHIAECTIPKGSLIYKDKTGLIVSNQIIINKILEKKILKDLL